MHVLDMPHGMTDINVVKYQLCAEMVITKNEYATNRKSYRQVDTPPLPLHSSF